MASNTNTKTAKDPNMMTSPMFALVRAHWYVSVKVVALYVVLYLITFSFSTGTGITAFRNVVTMLAWVFFDYTDIYTKAMRDVNLVKYGYLEYDKLRGLKSGLLAQIPGVIIIALIWLTRGATDTSDLFRVLYFILYSPAVQLIAILEDYSFLFLFLPLLVVPIVSQIGYYCGYQGLAGNTMNRLIYRGRKKKR